MKRIYLLMLAVGMIAFTSCGKEEALTPANDMEVEAPLTKGPEYPYLPQQPNTRNKLLTVHAYFEAETGYERAGFTYRLYLGREMVSERWVDGYDGSSYDHAYRGFEKDTYVYDKGTYTIYICCQVYPYKEYQKTIMTRNQTNVRVMFDRWGRIEDEIWYR